MTELRVPVDGLKGELYVLDRDASHYVLDVHRRTVGDTLCLFDPSLGMEADAVVVGCEGRRVLCRLSNRRVSAAVVERPLTVVQAYGKGDKIDRVVRDATALGATRILVVVTERAVVKPDAGDVSARQRRWERIAIEAARQSGRGDVPSIRGPLPWSQLAHELKDREGLRLMLDPGAVVGLAEALREGASSPAFTVLIGPEGGLSPGERVHAVELGFVAVRFGRFILRTETATTALLGALLCVDEQRRGAAG